MEVGSKGIDQGAGLTEVHRLSMIAPVPIEPLPLNTHDL